MRSQIRFAPYNPRRKDPKVVARLKANFKKVGFLGGIIWNAKSRNLVGGHKRTEALDLINGYDGSKEKDYKIKVERVDLDEKTEKEQNIFLNSATVQGEFDLDLLKELVPDIDPYEAGLDDADLNIIGVDYLEETDEMDEDMKELVEAQDDIKKTAAEKKQAVKDAKAAHKDKLNEEWEGDEYFTVTFDNYKAKKAFMERLGLDGDDRFVKGEILAKKVEIKEKF
jgi:hypothetical protein